MYLIASLCSSGLSGPLCPESEKEMIVQRHKLSINTHEHNTDTHVHTMHACTDTYRTDKWGGKKLMDWTKKTTENVAVKDEGLEEIGK